MVVCENHRWEWVKYAGTAVDVFEPSGCPLCKLSTTEKDTARIDMLDRADIVTIESGPLGFSCFEEDDLRVAIDEYTEKRESRDEVQRLKRLMGKI